MEHYSYIKIKRVRTSITNDEIYLRYNPMDIENKNEIDRLYNEIKKENNEHNKESLMCVVERVLSRNEKWKEVFIPADPLSYIFEL